MMRGELASDLDEAFARTGMKPPVTQLRRRSHGGGNFREPP